MLHVAVSLTKQTGGERFGALIVVLVFGGPVVEYTFDPDRVISLPVAMDTPRIIRSNITYAVSG